MTSPLDAHPDDDVTDAQRSYTTAFVQWIRTGSNLDDQRRESAFTRMMLEAAGRRLDGRTH